MKANISIYNDNDEVVEVEIEIKKVFEINGVKMMLHREYSKVNKGWIVSEYSTGYNLNGCPQRTIKEAIEEAQKVLTALGVMSQKIMNRIIKEKGAKIINE